MESLRAWLQKLSLGVIEDRDCRQIIQVYHAEFDKGGNNARSYQAGTPGAVCSSSASGLIFERVLGLDFV